MTALLREHLIVLGLLLRCWFRGLHHPVLIIANGEIYVRCCHCWLRSPGIRVPAEASR